MRIIPLALVLALPGVVGAQNPPRELDSGSVSSSEQPADPAVVVLNKGAEAPFKGLLVSEGRFVELLEAEIEARELAVRLKAAERTAMLIEQVYLMKLEQAAIVHWYDSPSFNRWLGIFLGTGMTSLAIWGTGQLNN